MSLQVLDFIHQHTTDWRERLAQKPYCVTAKEDGPYVILNYNQIHSDFNEPIARECRGLIIKRTEAHAFYAQIDGEPVPTGYSEKWEPVCVPFFKFGNYSEAYCPEIDWPSARILEKVDGSLIKTWFDDGQWRVSTSSVIDAHKAPINNTELSFGELFLTEFARIRPSAESPFDGLDKDCTYMFELCSPYNRVVVPHTEPKIYHIGTRNNKTLEELNVDIGIQKPKEYKFNSIADCVVAAKELSFCEEGYVVLDQHWNRVKIKSPAYVRVFAMGNNGLITPTRIIDLLRAGEQDEFLTYYPEYQNIVDNVQKQLYNLELSLDAKCATLAEQTFEDQKSFALQVKDDKFAPFYFDWRKRGTKAKEWMASIPAGRLAKYIEE